MKKWIFGILIALAAIAVGVGSAYAVNRILPPATLNARQAIVQKGPSRPGTRQYFYGKGNPGRFNRGRFMNRNYNPSAPHIGQFPQRRSWISSANPSSRQQPWGGMRMMQWYYQP